MPIAEGDSWPDGKMEVRRTRADPTRKPNDGAGPTTYANSQPHWWDSSQVYGESPLAADTIRSHKQGKLNIDPSHQAHPARFERARNHRQHLELVGRLKSAA